LDWVPYPFAVRVSQRLECGSMAAALEVGCFVDAGGMTRVGSRCWRLSVACWWMGRLGGG